VELARYSTEHGWPTDRILPIFPPRLIPNHRRETQAMHVDKSTKLDKVVVGDQVKAYVTDQGHVITLQRQAK
jgi:hypothetical protein